MKMRLFGVWLILLCCVALPIRAQQTARDYAITDINYVFSEDQSIFTVSVVVQNQGSAALEPTQIIVLLLTNTSPEELVRDTINALNADASITIQIPFNTADFAPGSQQVIQIAVGLDSFELQNTPIAANNVATVSVPIPTTLPTAVSTPAGIELLPDILAFNETGLVIMGEQYDRQQVAIGALVVVGVTLFLWLITVILRLIFRRSPRFGVWQPPYGMMPIYDQNSVEGRRQAWQQHAQNSLLLGATTDNNLHAVKVLTGVDGQSITNWKVTAMRLSQYDTYGRIARTESVADKKVISRLNHVLRKYHSWNQPKLQKQLQSIAKGLVAPFRKKLNKKNAFLPIAFDMRFQGKHGEVRIFFELYQFQKNAWYRIDQWEPAMAIVSAQLQENFTYTIHGMSSGEAFNDFSMRLQEDITWLLLEMLRIEPPIQQTTGNTREAYDIPDTLSGMEPIHES